MKKEPIQVTPSWGNDKWSDPDSGSATSGALDAEACSPSDYYAGLLSDYGGGDVEWWQDYLRAEIGRANDHWREQYAEMHDAMVIGTRLIDRDAEQLRDHLKRLCADIQRRMIPNDPSPEDRLALWKTWNECRILLENADVEARRP